jgi:hypothetical protein
VEYKSVVEWLQTCPNLMNLWAISATIQEYTDVIKVNDIASLYSNVTVQYADDRCRISGIPQDDYYITYTINCYRDYVENQNDYNFNIYDETQSVCDWLIQQQNELKLPIINGTQVYFVECMTPLPLEQWVDEEGKIIAYYVTFRLHFPNPAQRVDYMI